MFSLLYINNNENLKQGKVILDKKNKLTGLVQPDMNSTDNSTTGSLIESLENNTLSDSDKHSLKSVSVLEDEFNKTLTEYTKNYQLLMDELITNNKNPVLLKYANKNVKLGNKYYYVNNFGFWHAYSDSTWKSKSTSCSSPPVTITQEEFNKLLKGPDMGLGQECDVAGYNIENQTTSERSWVDIKGVKHIYPKDIWNNRSESCKTASKSVKSAAYISIPSDQSNSKLTKNSICSKLNIDPRIMHNLAYLNDKLLTLAKELLRDINSLATTDSKQKIQLEKLNDNMMKHINSLESDKQQFSNSVQSLQNTGMPQDVYNSNLAGIKQSSEYKLSSHYLQYIFWLIVAVGLILFTFYNFSSDTTSSVTQIILLIVALVLLYKLFTYIRYKIF